MSAGAPARVPPFARALPADQTTTPAATSGGIR